MEREAIFNVLRALVAEETKVDEATITEATTRSEIGLESLEMATLLVELESQFNIQLEEAGLTGDPSMGDIVDLIESNIGAGG